MSRISLAPPQRRNELMERLEEVRCRDSTSYCGSLTYAYHCMCDYHGVPFSEEVAWVNSWLFFFSNYLSFVEFDFHCCVFCIYSKFLF